MNIFGKLDSLAKVCALQNIIHRAERSSYPHSFLIHGTSVINKTLRFLVLSSLFTSFTFSFSPLLLLLHHRSLSLFLLLPVTILFCHLLYLSVFCSRFCLHIKRMRNEIRIVVPAWWSIKSKMKNDSAYIWLFSFNLEIGWFCVA